MKLLLRWITLIYLSAIAGFMAAITSKPSTVEHIIGMLLGISTFVLIYCIVDRRLLELGKDDWRKSLVHSIYIKMSLQLIPAIELGAGFVSGVLIEESGFELPRMLDSYIMTLLVGLQLSLVVCIIFIIVRYVVYLKRKIYIQVTSK